MLELQSRQTKIIHVELEFIILEFLCFSILCSPMFFNSASLFFSSTFSTSNLCSDRFVFFGSAFSSLDRSAFSTPNICFSSSNLRFSDHVFFFLWIWFFSSSDLQILLESKKLEFYVDKLLHLRTRTRVFEARFCHRTQVSKTRDASFLNGFKTLLTNDILS